MTNYIEEFKTIMCEEDLLNNNSLTDNTIKKLNDILPYCLGEILINIVEIDEELKNIRFTTRFNIYNYLFSKDIYESLKSKLTMKSIDYYKGICYGGVICELVKINVYDNFILSLTDNNLIINILKETIEEQKEDSKILINTIYNDIKENHSNDEIYDFILDLLKSNNYSI